MGICFLHGMTVQAWALPYFFRHCHHASEAEFGFWLGVVGESGISHDGEDVHTFRPYRPGFLEGAWLLCLSRLDFDDRRHYRLFDFRHPDCYIVRDFVLPDEILF